MKALKALEKPLGFFLYPLKTLKKAIGKFLPNRWKRWKKPLGFFPLPDFMLYSYTLRQLYLALGNIN